VTYPPQQPGDSNQFPAAPPYQQQPYQQPPYQQQPHQQPQQGYPQQPHQPQGYPPPGYPQQGYPQQGYAPPGYAPPGYYGQTGGPQFLPPEAGKHNARFDPAQPVRVLASPGRRLAARLIDMVVLFALFAAGAGILALIFRLGGVNQLRADTAGGVIGIVLLVLLGIGWMLYDPLFVSKKGGTPGKLWLGIRVVRTSNAGNVSFGMALGRYFFPFLMTVIPLAGLLNALWLLWDRPLYQCLHDKVVGSVVVYAEGSAPQGSVAQGAVSQYGNV
jgi:uncharacterized RDD family membrane protein YckC